MYLRVSENRGEHGPEALCFLSQPGVERFGARLILVAFKESGRIQVKHYLRSSMIIWDPGLPRDGAARNFPRGRLARRILPSASSFFSTSEKVSCASPSSSGGQT